MTNVVPQAPYFTVPYFSDENEPYQLSNDKKLQLFLDWDHFIRSGFTYRTFSTDLYYFLIHHCGFSAHTNQQQFWTDYFGHSLSPLRAVLRQFGGDRHGAETPGTSWLHAPGIDLKLAMCERMYRVYAPVTMVLTDLEQNHNTLVKMWFEFAQRNQVQTATMPTDYTLTENSHCLLAFCIGIALEQGAFQFWGKKEGKEGKK